MTHPLDDSYVLIEVTDLDRDPPPPAVRARHAALRTILTWAREYLSRPHPQLGRAGNVCPYTQAALDRSVFYLAVHPGREHDADEVARRLVGYRDWFLELSAAAPQPHLVTILNLYPDLLPEDVPRIIDATQARLKPRYVARGLMLGEFHAGPPAKAGLWNEHFRPLHSPVPLLAIRHMVPTDFLFLRDDPDHVRAYLSRFRHQIPAHLHAVVRETAQRFGLELTPVGPGDTR